MHTRGGARPRAAAAAAVLLFAVLPSGDAVAAAPKCNGFRAEIVGTDRADVIRGTGGADVIAAKDGNDVIKGKGGADLICGGKGADTLTGGKASDGLFGGKGGDTLTGGKGGVDFLQGDEGNDELAGGVGTLDQISFLTSDAPVVANLVAGTASGEGDDSVAGIEGIVGSPFDDDLRGDAAPNLIEGSGGNDILAGGGELDVLIYFFSPSGVIVNLIAGTASGGEGDDTLTGFERVEASNCEGQASDCNDILIGTGDDDQLLGFEGDDMIVGANGNDFLVGHSGIDNIDAGGGNDEIYPDGLFDDTPGDDIVDGGTDQDRINFSESEAAVTVDLDAGTAQGEGADQIAGIESVVGSDRGDDISGDEGPNTLLGGGRADDLFGLAGDDELDGGTGANDLDGGDGSDHCVNFDTQINCETFALAPAHSTPAERGPLHLGRPSRAPWPQWSDQTRSSTSRI